MNRSRSWGRAAGVAAAAAVLAAAGPAPAADPVPGEPLQPVATQRVGTLIGYGQPMLRRLAPANVAAEAAGGDVVWGTDIGVPITLTEPGPDGLPRPITFFLFGDTDQLDHRTLDPDDWVRPYRAPEGALVGPYGVLQGDAVAYTTDPDAADGIAITHLLRNREPGEAARACSEVEDAGFRAMYVPGVHPSPCATVGEHGGQIVPFFLTPTGGWAMDGIPLAVVADQTPYDGIPQARSYLAASTDGGLTWNRVGAGPLSQPSPDLATPARFVHVDAVPVDAADYQDAGRSGPCLLPLPPGDDTRGWLLLGAGLWNWGDIYLAFLPHAEVAAALADPSHRIRMHYFVGTSGASCWSEDEADAVPVVRPSDNRAFARLELACGNHVIQDTGGAGYVTVTRLVGDVAGLGHVDRLVMLYKQIYFYCRGSSPDACCGGTPIEGGTMCSGPDYAAFADFVGDVWVGVVMVSGDPWRPWIWNTLTPLDELDGTMPDPATHPLRPAIVPPDRHANTYGSGPLCQEAVDWRDVLNGYAPLILDAYSGPRPDGTGFDLYFLLSRWGAKVSPDDPGDADQGYRYQVDVFRTTLVPVHGVPRRRVAPPPGPTPAPGRGAAPSTTRDAARRGHAPGPPSGGARPAHPDPVGVPRPGGEGP